MQRLVCMLCCRRAILLGCTCAAVPVNHLVLIIGGRHRHGRFNDIAVLDTRTYTATTVKRLA